MKHLCIGAGLAGFFILSWMLFVMKGNLAWDITAIGWAVDAFLVSTAKAFA